MGQPPRSNLFPDTTLFRSWARWPTRGPSPASSSRPAAPGPEGVHPPGERREPERSEEHTSELQSRQYLVCRLLLEKKKLPYSSHVASSIPCLSWLNLTLST